MKTNTQKAKGELQPTLWRTARVLAAPARLDCLRQVVGSPGLCVEEVADAAGIQAAFASMSLRALQARGLISARRESRWVRYFPEADPLVPSAAPILACMAEAFRTGISNEQIIHQVTAFTHPRRLTLLRRLSEKSPMAFLVLAGVCGMSLSALVRHVRKLEKRALVSTDEAAASLLPVPSGINETFLSLIGPR
jgi:DNA-binding transcriptional ArsR family regulator